MIELDKTFMELAIKRYSTRKYLVKDVELEKIQSCIEAARMAPSACNSQPWRFHVVREPNLRSTVAKATLQKGIALNKFTLEVPVLVVLTVSKGNLKTKVGQMVSGLPYYLIDAGIAAEHFCLQASALGLGTCMIGWFQEKVIKANLNVKSDERVALVIALGYPEDDFTRAKVRKELEEISVYYE